MTHRLLIAESDDLLRDVYHRFFTANGYQVETAADGIDCVSKLKANPPDVLVAKWNIPWGGGDGIVDWLQDRSDLNAIDVVVITAGVDPDGLTEQSMSSVVACLREPFSLTLLLQAIQRAIEPPDGEPPGEHWDR